MVPHHRLKPKLFGDFDVKSNLDEPRLHLFFGVETLTFSDERKRRPSIMFLTINVVKCKLWLKGATCSPEIDTILTE